ncbi:hypothetical protein [Alienimonas chondri]|uniref:DUF4190 domain-containing protein n=1 Tax=Alienimonas chondri TaxID=2681879 RepID=A0ABX1VFV3_9PLAN|nr:hypothetical protein [Alienimonas chondri]NNJ26331.1 hypothetical protein [Alienimonas chondri]
MSTATFDTAVAPLPQAERVDFDYKPIPVSAPVSAVLGLCSLVAFLPAVGIVGFLIATAGLVTAFIAWRTIRTQDGAGLWIAGLGMVLSLTGLAGGATYHSVAYAGELPEGHTRIDFTADISEKAVAPQGGVSQAVQKLDGEKIFLKGYMYPDPSGQVEDLGAFVFVKDSGECCFGGKPKLTDMIRVDMTGQKADFYSGLVSVAGTFEVGDTGSEEEVKPLFRIKATQAGPARTSF